MSRDEFQSSHRIVVRWAEVDAQSIVFNGNYLTYFDVGITEYWRSIGWVYPARFVEAGIDMFAVRAVVEYKNPARYDDAIDVLSRVSRIGRTSLGFSMEIHREEELLVQGELVYVCADSSRKPVPIPEVLREAIAKFEKIAPAGGSGRA